MTPKIVSLWQLLHLQPHTFSALAFVAGCRGEWKLMAQLLANADRLSLAPQDIPRETRAHFIRSCEILKLVADQLGLRAAGMAAERARREGLDLLDSPIAYDHHRLARMVALSEQLLQVYGDELNAQKLLPLSPWAERLLSEEPQFGPAVAHSFPSAEFDIQEAAKCLAFDRATASVMHLMRVMELGLRVLAKHYGVEADASWNKTLNQIEAKIREIGTRSHGPRRSNGRRKRQRICASSRMRAQSRDAHAGQL